MIKTRKQIEQDRDHKLEKKQILADKKILLVILIKKELKKYTWKELSAISWLRESAITRLVKGTESITIKRVEKYIDLLLNIK